MRRFFIHCFVAVCLPWVTWWAWRLERRILRTGISLTNLQSRQAAEAGVQHPDKIRVARMDTVPMPGFRWMHRLAARLGFDGSTTRGMALRYGIVLRRDAPDDPALLLHECVHTGQYERCGSLAGFLRRYLTECLLDGYDASALEREARERSAPVIRA